MGSNSPTRDQTCTPAVEGNVLTTVLRGKSLIHDFMKTVFFPASHVSHLYDGNANHTGLTRSEWGLNETATPLIYSFKSFEQFLYAKLCSKHREQIMPKLFFTVKRSL